VLALARSGSIKERLADAYRNHLSDVTEDELPQEIRDEFRSLRVALTHEPPISRIDDSVHATLRKMANDEVERIASDVVQMCCVVVRASAPAVRVAPVAQFPPRQIAKA
jgi:hypothetical protein